MSSSVPMHTVKQVKVVLNMPRPQHMEQHLAGWVRLLKEKHKPFSTAEFISSLLLNHLLWFPSAMVPAIFS